MVLQKDVENTIHRLCVEQLDPKRTPTINIIIKQLKYLCYIMRKDDLEDLIRKGHTEVKNDRGEQ